MTVINECERKIYRIGKKAPVNQELLWWDIRDDAICELRGRQLELFKEPAERP